MEYLNALLFTVEGFHHDVTAVHLFHMPIDVPQVFLLLLEILLRPSNDQSNDDHREREDQKSYHGHDPIDGEHHDQHADHRYHRRDDLGEALA